MAVVLCMWRRAPLITASGPAVGLGLDLWLALGGRSEPSDKSVGGLSAEVCVQPLAFFFLARRTGAALAGALLARD